MDISLEENQKPPVVRAKILARLGFALWLLSLLHLGDLLHQLGQTLSETAGLGVVACVIIAMVPPLAIIAVPFMAITLFPLVGVVCAAQVNLLVPILFYNLERNRYPRRSLAGILVFTPIVAGLTALGCNPLPPPNTVTWPNVVWWAAVVCILTAGLIIKKAHEKPSSPVKPKNEIDEQTTTIELTKPE